MFFRFHAIYRLPVRSSHPQLTVAPFFRLGVGEAGTRQPLGRYAAELQSLTTSDAAHGEPVPPIVVVGGIDVRRIEVEVTSVRTTVGSSGPVVAVRPSIVERGTVVVATTQEQQHGDRVRAL